VAGTYIGVLTRECLSQPSERLAAYDNPTSNSRGICQNARTLANEVRFEKADAARKIGAEDDGDEFTAMGLRVKVERLTE
jgi:hypothetical protein